MANSPTIVSASLDDKEMRQSIANLVAYVKRATQTMSGDFDAAVEKMNASLKKLGTPVSGGSANTSATKQDTQATEDNTTAKKKNVQATKEQAQANKENKMTLDQMAQAQKQAVAPKSARDSFYAFVQGYKQQAQELSQYIKSFETGLNQAISSRLNELNGQLVGSKEKIRQLNEELNRRHYAAGNPQATAQIQSQLDRELRTHNQIETAIKNVNKEFTFEISYLASLYGELNNIHNKWHDVSATNKSVSESQKQQTEELRKQSVIVGEIQDKKSATKAFERISLMPSNTMEEIKAKGQALVELVKKVKDTPLMSQSNVKLAEKMIGSLANQYRALKEEKEKVAQTATTNPAAENTTKRSIEQEKRELEELKARQKERTQEIINTGLASQNTAKQLTQSINAQMQTADYTKQVDGVKDLQNAIYQMQNALKQPLDSGVKAELEKSLQVAREMLQVAQRYNMTVAGLGGVGVGGKAPTDTLAAYSAEAQRLAGIFRNLSTEERNAAAGKGLINKYQQLQRTSSQVRKELERPINLKAAMAGGENTIDEITYKIQRLQSYKQGLNFKTQADEISQVDNKIKQLNDDLNKYMGQAKNVEKQNNALGRSWNYMKNRLAFYFTVGASTAFVKNLIEVRSQYEMNERALGILVNSAERGTQIFNELSQMALVSPYTLIELSAAAKQLTAYDVAAKDVVDTTRRLADIAAAVGVPIERLTYALGQIKAYGYLNARDARMFANAGIPLIKNLSEYYTELEGRLVSTADIYDRIKKKQIGYEEVMSTISKMTDEGGKFYDFQAKMAETLKVKLANLTLAWNNMLNAIGEESQGVLVGGISTLKQLFLHWKDIEHVLYELVVALGAYKAYQIITTRLMGATAASLDAQVLAMKRNKAAMLEKQSLTRKLTYDEAKLIATQNQVTAADYRNALSGKQLTKQKALLLAAIYKNNVQLKAALVNMGLLTTAEVASITRGKALAIVFKSIGISIRNAALAVKSFMMSNWLMFAIAGAYELIHAYTSANEHIEEINKQAIEHAKETFDNIKQYLESESTINTRQRVVYKEGNPLTDAESQKAWDEMREKIELSSSASNTFIAKLMQINDINNRLAAGFDYLRDVQRVAGVMQTLEEDAVNISSTVLGGLFEEGLKDDLTDFINSYQKYVSLSENLRQSGVGEKYFNDIKDALEELRGEVDKTTNSIYDIASREGFNTNEQREFFEREISEIAQAEQMGAKETRIFRMQAEKEYYAYARAQLVAQLEYQQGAQKAATEKRIKDLDNEFGTNKSLQESFFTWLTEKQDHAVKNMLRGKTQEEIKQGEWLKGANAKWVEEMAQKFSKEYNVSFDDLRRLVLQANTWSINIPVFFKTIGQPLSDIQRDYEARTGKKFSSNPIIKDAKSQVEIIDILKKKQKEVANEQETARKAGGKYWEDNKKRLEDENKSLTDQIHAYNALTDAEEKADKKGKSSKKDILGDALSKEVQLITDIRKRYDEYKKAGVDTQTAIAKATDEYGVSLKSVKNTLSKFGITGLEGVDVANMEMRDLVQKFEDMKKTASLQGNVKGVEALEKAIASLNVEITKLDYKNITDGLNNELGKLKEEYELSVALDAEPELGDMFASMFGIDKSELPKTFTDLVDKAQRFIDKKFAEYGGREKFGMESVGLSALLDKKAFDQWVSESGRQLDSGLIKAIENARNFLIETQRKMISDTAKEYDQLLSKYAEYEYKQTKIAKDAAQERITLIKRFGANYQQKKALKIFEDISVTDDPVVRQQLAEQLKQIVNEIARDNDIALQIGVAIDKKEVEESAKTAFEEFQKSPEWIVATGDLAGITDRALGTLIQSLEEYKKKARNLDPKQIKQLNRALTNLYKEQRKGNPFKTLSVYMLEAKQRAADLQPEIDETEKKIQQTGQQVANALRKGEKTDDLLAKIDEMQKHLENLKKLQGDLSKLDVKEWIDGLSGIAGAAKQVAEVFSGLFDGIAGHETEFTRIANGVSTVMDKALAGASAGSAFGQYGAIVGGVLGGLGGIFSLFGDGKDSITRAMERSELAVKRLQNSMQDLEDAAEHAYGAMESGAKRAVLANKELQLIELKRQIQLEKSRDSKDRDNSKIADLEGQYKQMLLEIKNGVGDIVNEMLGISSAGDAATQLVETMVEAFRNGEDAMKAFSDKWDEMIDSMILKLIVSQYMQKAWDNVMKVLNQKEEEFLAASAESKAVAENDMNEFMMMSDLEKAKYLGILSQKGMTWTYDKGELDRLSEMYIAAWQRNIEVATEANEHASEEYLKWSLDYMMGEGRDYMEGIAQNLIDGLGDWYTFGENKDTALSALQAGISSITEDTAGAIEAYLNIISQQIFLHTDLLTQIRDAMVGLNTDNQMGITAQILLQLQSSYQVQMSIQSTLDGWSNASGQAVRVELIS